jgi:hypothetical protein
VAARKQCRRVKIKVRVERWHTPPFSKSFLHLTCERKNVDQQQPDDPEHEQQCWRVAAARTKVRVPVACMVLRSSKQQALKPKYGIHEDSKSATPERIGTANWHSISAAGADHIATRAGIQCRGQHAPDAKCQCGTAVSISTGY